MMSLTAAPASLVSGKGGEESLHAFGALDDAENDFCGDAEGAFGADEDAGEIVAGSVESFSAEMDEGAVGENDFETEDVGGGETVFQAVRAAGVFGDVAADAADGLRGGIGGVEIAVREDAGGDVEIDDAGFDDDAGVGEIDFENAVHAGEADDDAVFDGERAAAKAGAGAARDEGNFFAMAEAEDGLDLCGGCGEKDGLRHDAEIGEAVALVGVEFVGGGDEGVGADDVAELLEEARIHGGRLPEWGGKVKRGGRQWRVGRRKKQVPPLRGPWRWEPRGRKRRATSVGMTMRVSWEIGTKIEEGSLGTLGMTEILI